MAIIAYLKLLKKVKIVMASISSIPQFVTAATGTLHRLEQHLVDSQDLIEAWLQQEWLKTPAPLYSSVDLRNAAYKLAPVDTNLYPAGFNNLNPALRSFAVTAMQEAITKLQAGAKRVLLIPESHTRSPFYLQSLSVIEEILSLAGYEVRIGSLSEELTSAQTMIITDGKTLTLEPLIRTAKRLTVANFDPDVLVLNNDLSTGIPELLENLEQPIAPSPHLGWAHRLKSTHFEFYQQITVELASIIDLDPWLINPEFRRCEGVDFMKGTGLDCLMSNTAELFEQISKKYTQYQVEHKPYVVIKADAGTYGMGVMMVQDISELEHLNRKERTRMSTAKGSQPIRKVILQEGVYTSERWGPEQAVAEPVVYMINGKIVGSFYRVHAQRSATENLNAPGMHFESLGLVTAETTQPNRFYAYSVIARLASLAAARELASV